jgi:hypothetical protein
MKFISRDRDDLDRRDRERGAEEQRSHESRFGVRQQALRQHLSEREAAGKRNDDTGDRDEECGATHFSHQFKIGFHAGQQEQKKNAELGDPLDQRLLFRICGKDCLLRLRP